MAGRIVSPVARLSRGVVALAVLAIACGTATSPNPRVPTENSVASAAQTAAPTPAPVPTTSPLASPILSTAKPLGIGDPCLVGRWTVVNLVMTDSVSFPGITMTFTGETGSVMTLTADGTETFDLTSSTPLIGSGGGHTISWQGQGVQHFGFHGEAGKWSESGPPQPATATQVMVDGQRQADFSNLGPPVAGSYTCTGSELTMVVTAQVSQTARFKKAP